LSLALQLASGIADFDDIRVAVVENTQAEPAPQIRVPAPPKSLSNRHTNTLGMIFAPVPGTKVLFSIWDTRLKDFQAFVEETAYNANQGMVTVGSDGRKARGASWRDPGFPQGPTYPVCGVSWDDAHAFCRWLTEKERRSGWLDIKQSYRLPTDAEWSVAAGNNTYPCGNQWPPPTNAGNYAGEETLEKPVYPGFKFMPGFRDGFSRTSPVGSFLPNRYGLYDMGGNLWQWCEDWYRKEMNTEEARQNSHWVKEDGGGRSLQVLRGASWVDGGYGTPVVLSAFRGAANPQSRGDAYGFRCVLAP